MRMKEKCAIAKRRVVMKGLLMFVVRGTECRFLLHVCRKSDFAAGIECSTRLFLPHCWFRSV